MLTKVDSVLMPLDMFAVHNLPTVYRVVNIAVGSTAIIAISIAILFSIATGIAILLACLVLHVVLQYF